MNGPIDEFVTLYEDPKLVDLADEDPTAKTRFLGRQAEHAAKTLLEEMDKKAIDYGEHGEFYITVGYRRPA